AQRHHVRVATDLQRVRALRAGWLGPHQQTQAHNRNNGLHFHPRGTRIVALRANSCTATQQRRSGAYLDFNRLYVRRSFVLNALRTFGCSVWYPGCALIILWISGDVCRCRRASFLRAARCLLLSPFSSFSEYPLIGCPMGCISSRTRVDELDRVENAGHAVTDSVVSHPAKRSSLRTNADCSDWSLRLH